MATNLVPRDVQLVPRDVQLVHSNFQRGLGGHVKVCHVWNSFSGRIRAAKTLNAY